ncbi:MAG: rhomboid family intramembrane serine protease [Paracoccaceae bacterium]|jgi:membrane associated rhomboid family serine protease
MREGYDVSPFNAIPSVVLVPLLPILAIEIVLSLGDIGVAGGAAGIGWRQEVLTRFALNPAVLSDMIESGRWNMDYAVRFVTYTFVHGSFLHAIMVSVFTLALGKFVAEIFRPWAFLLIFLLSGISGAVVYAALPGQTVWLYGGYPAAYGLIGAFTFIVWARLGLVHANRNRAFAMVGILLGFQIVLWAILGGSLSWVADLGGFLAGFLVSFVVVPGGPSHILSRLRSR